MKMTVVTPYDFVPPCKRQGLELYGQLSCPLLNGQVNAAAAAYPVYDRGPHDNPGHQYLLQDGMAGEMGNIFSLRIILLDLSAMQLQRQSRDCSQRRCDNMTLKSMPTYHRGKKAVSMSRFFSDRELPHFNWWCGVYGCMFVVLQTRFRKNPFSRMILPEQDFLIITKILSNRWRGQHLFWTKGSIAEQWWCIVFFQWM